MPNKGGKKPIPGASAREERMYEDIKEKEFKSGKDSKTSKRIAAATVNKRRKRKKKEY